VPALVSLATGIPPERHGVVEARLPALGTLIDIRALPLVLKRYEHLTRIVSGPFPTPHRVLGRTLLGLAGVSSLVTAPLGPRELVRLGENEQSRLASSLTIVYLNECDRAGHRKGWMSGAYLEAAREVDGAVGELTGTVLVQDDALLLVTADHGGGGVVATDHDMPHPINDTIPMVAAGAQVIPGRGQAGVSLLDLPPTILRALAVPVPRSYAGRALDLFSEETAAVA
jgi:bisphosphoglycerate-independent phosphoglycerate mutase (AlkP superfamily)